MWREEQSGKLADPLAALGAGISEVVATLGLALVVANLHICVDVVAGHAAAIVDDLDNRVRLVSGIYVDIDLGGTRVEPICDEL
jgi:hypothetical protein